MNFAIFWLVAFSIFDGFLSRFYSHLFSLLFNYILLGFVFPFRFLEIPLVSTYAPDQPWINVFSAPTL